ncbi:BnaUnng01330D [Brassica napus]|uniref:BnaUnng01330D protein n=1 Tax=Brassica napus TaxID=3708 RepID=A0A078JEQ9_BRANA|nr:BnaUnng01330D [Brassica napus]
MMFDSFISSSLFSSRSVHATTVKRYRNGAARNGSDFIKLDQTSSKHLCFIFFSEDKKLSFSFYNSFSCGMDPFSHPCSFQNLLNSQQPNTSFSFFSCEPSIELSASDASVFGTQSPEDTTEDAAFVSGRKERRKWSPVEDVVLISAWLNTSKDPVTGNEQKAIAFWKRIAAYFASSLKLAGLPKREPSNCKQRWRKIKEVKFTLEHAWLAQKKRKLDDSSAQSSTSVAGEDEVMARPVGVKAAKAKGRRKATASEDEVKGQAEFQSCWDIRQKDFALKEQLNKQKLLDSLIAKTEPLSELEITLKNKLITDMLSIFWFVVNVELFVWWSSMDSCDVVVSVGLFL